MTYYIEVQETHTQDFLQIIQSLQNLGVVESYKPVGSLAREGAPLSTEALMEVLDNARQEVKESKIISSEEVKKQIDTWTKN